MFSNKKILIFIRYDRKICVYHYKEREKIYEA